MSEPVELFHRLAHRASGRVRSRIGELALLPRFSFRNVHFDSHRARLSDLGGDGEVPAIWDGEKLHVGEAACLELVERLAKS